MAFSPRKIGFRGSLRHFPKWNGVRRQPGGQGSRESDIFSGVRACEAVRGGVDFCGGDLELRRSQMGGRLHAEAFAPSPFRPLQGIFDPAQDHADVVSAAAHDRMEHVALGPLERAARQTAVALHVPDHRLDGRPAPDVPAQRRGHAPPLSRNEDLRSLHAVAAADPVDEGAPGSDAGHLLHLPERLGERVAVMGSAREGHGADDEALLVRDRQRVLDAELAEHARLALGDAVDVRFAQGVELVLVAGLLLHEPFGQGEFPLEPLEDAGAADQGKLPADVRRDQFREAAQLRQRLSHLLELAPPAQPAHLAEKIPGKPRVCPPGLEAALAGEFQQALAGLVAKLPVQRVGNVLVHHRDVDDQVPDAASAHRPTRSPALMVAASSRDTPRFPSVLRQREREDGSTGKACCMNSSPQKNWK